MMKSYNIDIRINTLTASKDNEFYKLVSVGSN